MTSYDYYRRCEYVGCENTIPLSASAARRFCKKLCQRRQLIVTKRAEQEKYEDEIAEKKRLARWNTEDHHLDDLINSMTPEKYEFDRKKFIAGFDRA